MPSKAVTLYPLRYIVSIVRVHDNYPFGKNRVRLECGHEVLFNAQYKAHCRKCYLDGVRRGCV